MAVYTEVSIEDLEPFLAQYSLGQIRAFKGIAEGVENSNYLLQTDRGSYILTLYEKRVDPEDLPFFLGLMEHLAAKGISCPTPVHALDGAALRNLCGRPAVINTFLPGVSLQRPGNVHCAALGKALAEMHVASSDFTMTRENDLSIAGWRRLVAACGTRADVLRPNLAASLAREIEMLSESWPKALPRGIVHTDLFPDNVFFLDSKVSGLIDFYFACTDFLAFDIAVCLNAWCFETDHSFNVTKARHLLSGYRQVREITHDEAEMLPILAHGAAFRFLLTRLYDYLNQVDGALVRTKDPMEFFARMRFHQHALGPGAYGID